MFKKILIGFAVVMLICVLARSGYEFGKSLASKDKVAPAAADSAKG